MKKVLFIMLIVGLLVALAVPVFADKDGVANDKAKFGQFHKNIENYGFEKVSDIVHPWKEMAADMFDMNLGQFIKEYVKPNVPS